MIPSDLQPSALSPQPSVFPLLPLSPRDRLAWLDLPANVQCISNESAAGVPPEVRFATGQTYTLTSATIGYNRPMPITDPLTGQQRTARQIGHETLWLIHPQESAPQESASGVPPEPRQSRLPISFLDESLIQPGTHFFPPISAFSPQPVYPLHLLLTHFHIPEIPSLATAHPEAYQKNLELLTRLERILKL